MEICVTKHSIQRYRERLFDYSSSDDKIGNLLREVALQGTRICMRPNNWKNCFELKYKGIYIVLLAKRDKAVVLTCLGDKRYRKWVKGSTINKKLRQDILYRN